MFVTRKNGRDGSGVTFVQRGLQQPSLRPWKTTLFDKHKAPFFGLLAALYLVKMSGGGMDAVVQASKNGNDDDVLALFCKSSREWPCKGRTNIARVEGFRGRMM